MAELYDMTDSVFAQRISQLDGVGSVQINGAEKPAVRVRLDPAALAAAGLSGQDVFNAIRLSNVFGPTGGFDGEVQAELIGLNGQMVRAAEYRPLVLKTVPGGGVVRLGDVAEVVDGVTNARLAAWLGTKPAILMNVTKAAGANVIETVDRIKALLPQLQAWMPPDVAMTVIVDRTQTIRASVAEVRNALLISCVLVLLVVLLFLRRLVPTLAAAVTVPLSLAGEAAYVASKAAVEALTKVAATELQSYGIRVNAVGLGPVDTDLTRAVGADKLHTLNQRIGRPQGTTLAEAVVFIAQEWSAPSNTTGSIRYLGQLN
jgi:multidrug efflux pump